LKKEDVEKLLKEHPEMTVAIQYVNPGKDGRGGYYRVKPSTYFDPHPNQITTNLTQALIH
jgi:hypothetical protein